MRVLLQLSAGERELVLRARAMECVGHMNLAVGRAHCEGALHELTACALQGLTLDAPELREATHGFFAQLAELIGVRGAVPDGADRRHRDPSTSRTRAVQYATPNGRASSLKS